MNRATVNDVTMIYGDVMPGYEPVAQAFSDLFQSFGEVGASVALQHRGETVVHLWGGSRDKSRQLPWQEDTRSNIFSAGKAIVAVAVLQLVERQQLSLDQPIAELWPEFGCMGKESITLRQVLCHRSGVSAFHDPVAREAVYDWATITQLVATETPWWPPGTEQGYSPMLYGWLLGEVVRRVSGSSSFNAYIQEFIAGPLGMDCVFGLSDQALDGVADVVPLGLVQSYRDGSLLEVMKSDPRGVANRAFSNPSSLVTGTNKPAWRQAQIPAANGHATGPALATFYGSLANLDDERLLSVESRPWCWQEQSSGCDKLLQVDLSFSLGFMRLLPQGVRSQHFFCHPGAGGSLGYGDAQHEFGLGYVTRAMGQAILMDVRAEHLLESVYQAVRG